MTEEAKLQQQLQVDRLRAMLAAAEGTMVREGWEWRGEWRLDGDLHWVEVRSRVFGGDRADRGDLSLPYARCHYWSGRDPAVVDLHRDSILECIEAAEAWLKEQVDKRLPTR